MREILTSKIVLPPKFRYSQGVKAGPHYYFSGMVAVDNDSGEITGEGPGAQTLKILDNLRLLMEEFGLDWENLVFARVYTTCFEQFAEINAAWEKVFQDITPPGRSTVGVSALPLGALVEMEFTFYRA